MPSYRIHHLTRYTYDQPVSVCHNLAHLLPRELPGHAWHFAELDIRPTPAVRVQRLDYFGNFLTFFAIQEPHRQLEVFARSRVDLEHAPPVSLLTSHPWELVRDALLRAPGHFAHDSGAFRPEKSPEEVAANLQACQFTFPSPYIRWNHEIAAYSGVSFPHGRPIVEALLDRTARIHRDFAYDTTSTTVSTTLPEIMQSRSGVCQDFAHFQIGCLRALGLAARYVSGYLLTTPPPGKPRLVGADASHAWLSVFLPGLGGWDSGGWLDFDPTNNQIPSDKHITLAWGRDFGDLSPLRGVLLGTGKHRIQVSVDVSPAA